MNSHLANSSTIWRLREVHPNDFWLTLTLVQSVISRKDSRASVKWGQSGQMLKARATTCTSDKSIWIRKEDYDCKFISYWWLVWTVKALRKAPKMKLWQWASLARFSLRLGRQANGPTWCRRRRGRSSCCCCRWWRCRGLLARAKKWVSRAEVGAAAHGTRGMEDTLFAVNGMLIGGAPLDGRAEQLEKAKKCFPKATISLLLLVLGSRIKSFAWQDLNLHLPLTSRVLYCCATATAWQCMEKTWGEKNIEQ